MTHHGFFEPFTSQFVHKKWAPQHTHTLIKQITNNSKENKRVQIKGTLGILKIE